MTLGFAVDYAERRMCELGYECFRLRFRHLVLHPYEKLVLDADNEYWYVVEDTPVKIDSQFGHYDLQVNGLNELQYEHYGKVVITNPEKATVTAKFLQCIPDDKTP